LKLYYFHVAPNPTRTRLYLREKGIEIDEELVDLMNGEQKSAAHCARDPFGKLPVLEMDDGRFLTESKAIMEYFEELRPEPPMLGTTPEERAHGRSLDRIADLGVLIATARIVHATRSPIGAPESPEIANAAREARAVTLRMLDQRLDDAHFLGGTSPSMADCTAWAGLNFGRFFEVELEPDFQNVSRWFEEFALRRSVTSL
jgi:glutathione S-transferase